MRTSLLLRCALSANAAFSLLSGLVLALVPHVFASMIGVEPVWLRAVGVGLVPFGAWVGWQASRAQLDSVQALVTVVLDALWVLGSVVLVGVFGAQFPVVGVALVLGVAAAVGLFAVLQWVGLASLYREEPGHVKLCLQMQVHCDADAMWGVVSDLGRISNYMKSLRSSRLETSGRGVGTSRVCEDVAGKSWREQVVSFEPSDRSFVVEFDAARPGFPFPFRSLQGGWSLQPLDDGRCSVQVWWRGRLTYPSLGPALMPILELAMKPNLRDGIHAMAQKAGGAVEAKASSWIAMPRVAVC